MGFALFIGLGFKYQIYLLILFFQSKEFLGIFFYCRHVNIFLIVNIHKSLIKDTPKTHPDWDDLQKSLSKISKIAEWVNEQQHRYEQNLKIIDMQNCTAGLLESHIVAFSFISVNVSSNCPLPPENSEKKETFGKLWIKK